MSFLRKQESRLLGPQKSPSPGLAEGQAGLSTARGEAGCFIRLNSYWSRKPKFQCIFVVMISLYWCCFCRLADHPSLAGGEQMGSFQMK